MKNENANVKTQKPTKKEIKNALNKAKEIKSSFNIPKPEPLENPDELKQKTLDSLKQKLDEIREFRNPIKDIPDTIVRDLTKEDSILKEFEKEKSNKKIFTEDDLKETLLNFSFVNDIMSKFNTLINDEAKDFLSKTRNPDEYFEDDDKNPNLFIKLTIIDDRDRMLFKEMLFGTSERRRPIFVNFGDYDFFFEYFDNDQPVFTFSKECFSFFFENDLDKLKEYIKKNKCIFDSRLKYSYISERNIKFDNIIVEIIDKNKKESKKEVVTETEKVTEEPHKDCCGTCGESGSEIGSSSTSFISKKVYKVKTIQGQTLFVITDNPGEIFEKLNVLSLKIIGDGFQL